jgi:type II secretory pathway component PulC
MKPIVTLLGALLIASSASTAFAAAELAKDEAAANRAEQSADKDKAEIKSAEKRLETARKRLEEAAREVAELSGKLATAHMPNSMVFLSRNPNRAMLGIGIGSERQTQGDDGVAVLSVSPGGPAANAGIKAGDVIVEINGKSLKRDKNDSPREKLLDAMGKLSPGEEVTVRYQRDGKTSIAKLKAEGLPQEMVRRELRMRVLPGDRRDFDFDFDMPHNFVGIVRNGPLGDMELVPLTSKLAQYFGIDKGLLIVRAPEDKDSKLEDGDVLMDIDGRVPTNPSHAFRILSSYQAGEKVTLNVWRQRKKTAISLTMPERVERGARPQKAPRPAREPRAIPDRTIPAPVPPPV